MPVQSVILYPISTCIHCRYTREFLEKHQVCFECVYLDCLAGDERKGALAAMRLHNPQMSVPTLVVSDSSDSSDTVIIGFKESEMFETLKL